MSSQSVSAKTQLKSISEISESLVDEAITQISVCLVTIITQSESREQCHAKVEIPEVEKTKVGHGKKLQMIQFLGEESLNKHSLNITLQDLGTLKVSYSHPILNGQLFLQVSTVNNNLHVVTPM